MKQATFPWISLAKDGITLPLIWPKLITLAESEVEAKKSWIQVAKTGTFHSSRYGKFSITKEDLSQMLHNFTHVTPQAPTEIPVDYDHLSMDPKQPGDGKAAGWFEGLELREDGDELWGEIRWTEPAATAIANSEYRFVSPTFVKDYVYKSGQKIGTTLLAAAITNHPFLEGMAALTLSSDLGSVAVPTGVDTAKINLGMGYEDKRRRVQGALREQFPAGDDFDWEPSVRDLDDTSVVYDIDGKMMRRTYTIAENGDVEFSATAVEVTMPAPSELPAVGEMSASKSASGTQSAKKGEGTMPDVIKLKDHKGQEVDVQADEVQEFQDEQIKLARDEATATAKADADAAAAAAKPPEGSVVIEASKLAELETSATQVKTLSDQVKTLETTAAESEKAQHVQAITIELDKLSAVGRITKPQRDWALSAFGEVGSRTQFDDWIKTVPADSVVRLGKAYGSPANVSPADNSGTELNDLATKMSKEEGISFAEALGRVSASRVDLSERYQDSFRDQDTSGSVPH